MKQLLAWLRISKQSNHQYLARKANQHHRNRYYIGLMEEARSLHPVIGLVKIYHLYQPDGIGRDAFVALGTRAGYSLDLYTTSSYRKKGSSPFPNLLVGKCFTAVNQLWSSDITYFAIAGTFYYLTFILDVYSRKIVGHQVAENLQARQNIRALKMAIRNRNITTKNDLIHHSDRGSQYTCDAYLSILNKYNIQISMCNSVFENTHMERVNGIIKNNYLIHWQPKNLNDLKRLTNKAVNNYNNCPHSSLNQLSPNDFEQLLPSIPMSQRTELKVYTIRKQKVNTMDPNQLELIF